MRPTLFAVSYAGLWGQASLTLEDFVAHARRRGFDAIEIMGKRPHLSPLDWDQARLQALAALCADQGVEVVCVASYTNWLAGASAAEVPLVEVQIMWRRSLGRPQRSRTLSYASVPRTTEPTSQQRSSGPAP